MSVCTCTHARADHGERLAGTGKVRMLADGCLVCPCESFMKDEAKTAILPDEQRTLARSLIGQQQQIILKYRQAKETAERGILASQRVIDDLKNQFGLKE